MAPRVGYGNGTTKSMSPAPAPLMSSSADALMWRSDRVRARTAMDPFVLGQVGAMAPGVGAMAPGVGAGAMAPGVGAMAPGVGAMAPGVGAMAPGVVLPATLRISSPVTCVLRGSRPLTNRGATRAARTVSYPP